MSLLRISYQTIEFNKLDIHLRTLRDNQEYSDVNGEAEALGISSATWPLFGLVWPSSKVLANLMLDYDVKGLRILEVGCGIGLSSLILNQREMDISATDYHPEVKSFLEKNVKLNEGKPIPFTRTGWADENDDLGKFDLIIGSDLLYESDHSELLSEFIENHSNKECEVIIVDPGRGNFNKFSQKMVDFGYEHSRRKPEHTTYLEKPFKGQILFYKK